MDISLKNLLKQLLRFFGLDSKVLARILQYY